MSGVLVVGEALVDVVQEPSGASRSHPGGSPMNVAYGLARLGREAHLLTRFGDDEHGRLLREHLEAGGVRLVPGSIDSGRTATATATLDAAGVATYDFDIDWHLGDVELPEAPLAVHTGSIGAFLEPGAATVERILLGAHRKATISFDPNARPALMGDPVTARAHVEALVATSDVVKVSDEDLAWLAPGADPVDILGQWLRLGPSVVVVTRGGEGATALARSGRVDQPTPTVQVVDTVGAGDAFSSGLLDALWTEDLLGGDRRAALREIDLDALQRVLAHAATVAAITVTRAGAEPPTRADLQAWSPPEA